MTDPSPLIGPIPAPELHVMTYNIRRRMPRLTARAVDQWERRKPLVRRLLQEESPSILAVQEALPDQAQWVHESLGASFEGMGFGRDADRGGERVMLFVDRSRFAVRDWSQIALSATPDVAGSRSWGNRIPRTAVIAELTDHATNREFTVVATHFDHLSRRSRLRSAELVAERITDLGRPAIVMGDTNTDVGTEPYRALLDEGGLADSWVVAGTHLTPHWGTYSNYRPPKAGRRIDWLTVSAGAFEVVSAAINATRYDTAPGSDHEAVQAVLRFTKP
ncbi:endonuclease/exonuclease/phosphatase family metal-dependent hydrolase [Rathayibacter sp. PhB127]|uniref:endonuclease/exonuclease/phosphatase family protein n=1 Tax=unclassified Rathayibacter TaxID=2609250 RepID=UPI000F4CD9C5|nr:MULTISPECIES: endonuclease/exonuclease/phosphatase family protein [unclassified Rathayibacter]ROS28435.1 endonuclease/exonuclease/phosphatase family metal-dependent hydrolase [Rathayibacter sp. PhB127]TDX81062.1 endonuclease/exonuclease/phosphatase family metal-dependent hydrolase [Rathayibacter sp. PhB151]